MTDKKLYSSANSNPPKQVQNEAYWAKLRNEFQRGQHLHSGAYCASAHPKQARNPLS